MGRGLRFEPLEPRFLLAADFGDAPTPYPLANHTATGPTLGSLRDTELSTVSSLDFVGDGADEDGVNFGAIQQGQIGATVTVNVQNAPAGARIDAWIDFNGDGDWSDAGERIFDGAQVVAGNNVLTFDVPAAAAIGQTFARFRLSTAGHLAANSTSTDGEVEDYPVAIDDAGQHGSLFATGRLMDPLSSSPSNTPVAALKALLPVDFDADGDVDVISGGYFATWWENLGAGGFSQRALTIQSTAVQYGDVGQMNADGKLDFVYAQPGGIFWRQRDKADGSASTTVASGLTSVAGIDAVDFDGDGDDDVLAVTGGTARVVWYENTGTGATFTPHVVSNSFTQPKSIRGVDMDGADDLDLLVGGGQWGWYENDGSPQTFTLHLVASMAATATLPTDLDGDGDVDVLTTDNTGAPAAVWFENDGAQNFTRRLIESGVGTAAIITAVADLDADGDLDVLANSDAKTTWYVNDGAESFTPVALGPAESTGLVAAADFNGDGLIDVLSTRVGGSSGTDNIVLREQLGPSDFGDAPAPYPVSIADRGARHRAIGPQLGAARDVEPSGVASQGATGDGVDDDGVQWSLLRVGQIDATLTVNVQNAPAGARIDAWIDFNRDEFWGGADEQILASAAVVNGANVLHFDIPASAAAGATYARVRLSTAGGLGHLGPAADGEVEDYAITIAPPALAAGGFQIAHAVVTELYNATAVHAADLDGDGDMDVVAMFGAIAKWYENSAGSYVPHNIGSAGNLFGSIVSVEVADLDGDGDPDIILAGSGGNIVWYENSGNAQFTYHGTAATVATPSLLAAMDVNGDGHLDLVTTRRAEGSSIPNPMVWFENDGRQNFREHKIGPPTSGFVAVTAGDFDGNGRIDFIAAANAVELFTNPELTVQNYYSPLTVSPLSTTSPVVADLDNDGDLDLVAVSGDFGAPLAPSGASAVLAWYNNGVGAFTQRLIGYSKTPTSVGAYPRSLAPVDVDGDGDVDLLGAGEWLENTGGAFASHAATYIGSTAEVFAADMDGDGDADALYTDGASIVWRENSSAAHPDFGDAPAPYPTTLVNGGAYHGNVGPRLGATRDDDADGAPSAAADADAGDDGVIFGVVRAGAANGAVTINVQNAPAGARLDAWIDFNGDGSWSDAGDLIFVNRAVVEGDNALTFSVPAGAVTRPTFARFRLSTAGGLPPGGAAADGEVEDYAITIAPPAPVVNYEIVPWIVSSGSAAPVLERRVDLDGDGDMDVVNPATSFGALVWGENLGGGAFLSHSIGGSGAPTGPKDFQVVDYDRDGDLDIVATHSSLIGWFENNGAQSFAYRPITTSPNAAGLTVDVADFDGDGDYDILPVPSSFSSGIPLRWLRNDGRYVYTLQYLGTPTYSSAWGGRWLDLDGDHDVDFIPGSASNMEVNWLENVGGGVLSPRVLLATTRVFGLAAVDFDRDGDVDVVAATSAPGGPSRLQWLENLGTAQFAPHVIADITTGFGPAKISFK